MCTRRWLARAAGFVALFAAAGCTSGGGTFGTVSGVVTHNGTPVDGAKVTFYSTVEAEGQKGTVCSTTTDTSGKYVIATVGKDPGIRPGMYKVTVVKLNTKGGSPQEGIDAGQMEAAGQSGGVLNALPKEYESPSTTKLSVTVEPGKNENKNLDLKGTASKGAMQAVP